MALVAGTALLALGSRAVVDPGAPDAGALTHHVDVSYAATADPAVYQDGQLITGDPVFVQLNPSVDVHVRYEVSGEGAGKAEGVLGLNARLSAGNGWQRVVPLDPGQDFQGAGAGLRASLDLVALRDVITAAEQRTGVAEGSYRLELEPTVDGTVDGTAIELTSPVAFRLQGGQLVLDVADHPRGEPVTGTSTQASPGAPQQTPRLQLAGASLDAGTVQLAGWGCLALAAVLGGVGLLGRRDPWSRLGRPVLTVASGGVPDGTVRTASLDELLDLARRYDRPVLHVPGAEQSNYLVEEAGVWYLHVTSPQHSKRVRWSDRPGGLPSWVATAPTASQD